MNESFVSVFDLVESDSSGATLKSIRDKFLTMDKEILRAMDQGLTPDEMSMARTKRAMLQAAESILAKLSS